MDRYTLFTLALLLQFTNASIIAGEADVVDAKARCNAVSCTFNVTVKHDDQGWKHYADKWDIVAPDGKVIATRILHHPHVKEQPFTRSLGNISIPKNIKEVKVRAHDSVHEYGGQEITVKIDRLTQ